MMDNSTEFNFLKDTAEGIIVSIRISPNAAKNSVIGYTDDYLKIKISSPPIENKANKKLIEYLSEIFDIPKSKVSFVFGEKSKIKRILLSNLAKEDAIKKILVYDRIES